MIPLPRSKNALNLVIVLTLFCCASQTFSLHIQVSKSDSVTTPVYEEAVAYETLGYAQAAYCPSLESWSCGAVCRGLPTLVNVSLVEDAKTYGRVYVGYQEKSDVIIVSFRGTVGTSFKNWWSDLSSIELVDTPRCPAKNCQIGNGFVNAYDALREKLLTALQLLKSTYPSAKVHITGHSLGGALAHICAVDLKNVAIEVNTVISFGSPRTGNDEFVRQFTGTVGEYWRVTHHNDPIVHLPMWVASGFGFAHVPTEVFYSEEKGLTHQVCDGSGEDGACSWGFILPFVEDHLHYLDLPLGSFQCPE